MKKRFFVSVLVLAASMALMAGTIQAKTLKISHLRPQGTAIDTDLRWFAETLEKTSGGKLNSPVQQRVFWAVMEGVVASVLLLGGGLTILQTASISTGLPFTIILLMIVYALYLGLSEEAYMEDAVQDTLEDVHAEHKLTEAIADAHDDFLTKQSDE